MSPDDLKKTALHAEHVAQSAKMVEFGGWHMPISYEGVLAEHKTVRETCGVFDVSHMGEIRVTGPDAEKFLQKLTINDVSRLANGEGQYSALLNDQAGMIDDLILYRLQPDMFFICVNASNIEKDYQWIKEHASSFNVKVENESPAWSQLAIQGPQSVELLAKIKDVPGTFKDLAYMQIAPCRLFGEDAFIARTGYTGEHGYEIYLKHGAAVKLWRELIKVGVKPIGLGARDTLRLEACYLLYGNDMNDEVSPLEAGIGWAVRLEKPDFIGKKVLEKQKEQGAARKIVAFIMEDKGIARHGMQVFSGAKAIGEVTSASYLPTLDQAGGMALVSAAAVKIGDTFEIDIRGKRKLAKVVKRPLYSARTK